MLKTIELDNTIDYLFRGEDLTPEAEEELDNLNREYLAQTVQHRAEPVYAYSANDYRGELLFRFPATLLYFKPYIIKTSDSGAVFAGIMELWLLDDMTLAVVSCAHYEFGDGAFSSDYRVLKTKDRDLFPHVIDLDFNLLAFQLADMCDEYIRSDMPTYEL